MPVRDGFGFASKEHEKALESADDLRLASLEEAVLRMLRGLSGKGTLSYERRPVSNEVHERLLEIELRALEKTKRLEPLEPWLDEDEHKV